MHTAEIVIITSVDGDRLAELPAALDEVLDFLASDGLIGGSAGWAIYPTNLTIPGQMTLPGV